MTSPFGAPTSPPLNAPPAATPGIGVQPGISNGVIAANIVIVFGPNDGIFIYSGIPGLGTLIGSWAGMAGVDRFGNVYPAGLNVLEGAIAGSTFSGNDFIINTNGMFFYSGTPAAGNLVASIAPTVTADSFGNVVKPGGFAAYGSTGQIAFFGINGVGSQVNNFFSGNANEKSPATIASAAIGSGGTGFIGTAIEGPVINLTGHADWVGIQFNSPNFGGTSTGNGSIFYVDNAGTTHQVAFWNNTGFNIVSGTAALQSGSATNFLLNQGSAFVPADGNSYTPGLMTVIVPNNVVVNTLGTVNLGPGFNVEGGVTYRIKMMVAAQQGAVASIQDIGFGGVSTAGGTTQIFVKYIQEGTAQAYSSVAHQSTIGFFASPAYVATRFFWLEVEGVFTPAANGVVNMVASCSVAADTFTVIGGSFCDIWIA
jgi:hypothetical protein